MAREMNVSKRQDSLKNIIAKTAAAGGKAKRIAAELTQSFKDDKTPKGKTARKVAQNALKVARVLEKAADSVSL